MSLRMSVGGAIREARILESITQEELSDRTGLSAVFIDKLENNQVKITIDEFDQIMSKLEFGFLYVLTEKENN